MLGIEQSDSSPDSPYAGLYALASPAASQLDEIVATGGTAARRPMCALYIPAASEGGRGAGWLIGTRAANMAFARADLYWYALGSGVPVRQDVWAGTDGHGAVSLVRGVPHLP